MNAKVGIFCIVLAAAALLLAPVVHAEPDCSTAAIGCPDAIQPVEEVVADPTDVAILIEVPIEKPVAEVPTPLEEDTPEPDAATVEETDIVEHFYCGV